MERQEHRAGSRWVFGVHCGSCSALLGWTASADADVSHVRCKECMESEVYDFHYTDTRRGVVATKTPKCAEGLPTSDPPTNVSRP